MKLGMEMMAYLGTYSFKIDVLARNVGIAKSSFYHLFKSKEEFFVHLARYWAWSGTFAYGEKIKLLETPQDKFQTLIRAIYKDRVQGLTWIQLRNLAVKLDNIKNILIEVEKARLEIVGSILEEMGFSKKDARIKAKRFMHMFLAGWFFTVENLLIRKRQPAKSMSCLQYWDYRRSDCDIIMTIDNLMLTRRPNIQNSVMVTQIFRNMGKKSKLGFAKYAELNTRFCGISGTFDTNC